MTSVAIIAHRGASGQGLAPENTLPAFRLALDLGADLVELDVHRSKDGAIVVIHDDRLDRTTNGHGAIRDLTLDEIRRVDAEGGAPVPTLTEVLDLIRDHGIALIEIKPKDITSDVVQTIREADATGFVVLQSFHASVIMDAFRFAPEIPRGLLIGSWTAGQSAAIGGELVRRAASVGAGVVVPACGLVTADLVRAVHCRGLGLWTFTVDDEETMRRLIESEVDGIITNYPDRLRYVLNTVTSGE